MMIFVYFVAINIGSTFKSNAKKFWFVALQQTTSTRTLRHFVDSLEGVDLTILYDFSRIKLNQKTLKTIYQNRKKVFVILSSTFETKPNSFWYFSNIDKCLELWLFQINDNFFGWFGHLNFFGRKRTRSTLNECLR